MTAVIRSGTTQFHASAWEFFRNDALDARNYFNPRRLRSPSCGSTLMASMSAVRFLLWKSHPTFFFYNMEWRSLVQGGLLNQTVPLPSTYGGDFGSTLIKVPTAAQVSPAILAQYAADGLTPGQPFPNNTIPTNLLDPNAQALLAAGIFPAPTSGKQFIGGNNVPTNVREEIAQCRSPVQRQVLHFRTLGFRADFSDLRDIAVERRQLADRTATRSAILRTARVIHTTYAISPTCSTKWRSTTTATGSPSFPRE